MNESEYYVHELEHNQNTIQGLESGLEETAEALKISEENGQYLEDLLAEQSSQFLFKDTEAQRRNKEVSALEKQVIVIAGPSIRNILLLTLLITSVFSCMIFLRRIRAYPRSSETVYNRL